jgi:hypothetical protein
MRLQQNSLKNLCKLFLNIDEILMNIFINILDISQKKRKIN